jgi:hypothetical protein
MTTSIGQENPPEGTDPLLAEFLQRRFISIEVALDDASHSFPPRKQMPYKPQVGQIYYFNNPADHNYDPEITSEGWWGLKSTGWVLIA